MYKRQALDNRGRVQADQETLETSVAGVYAAGDGLYGPATVVEGIRDGMKAAEAILGRAVAEDLFRGHRKDEKKSGVR